MDKSENSALHRFISIYQMPMKAVQSWVMCRELCDENEDPVSVSVIIQVALLL